MALLIGYVRVSKSDGSQVVDLQTDALVAAGVQTDMIYADRSSGSRDDRPGLANCIRALRSGDTLVIWKLDRLGRDLRHLVTTVDDLAKRNVGLRVLAGHDSMDTTTAQGRLLFGLFATLAEFERSLIRERTIAGLASARARGRVGGRRATMTPAMVRLAQAAMRHPETIVADLCKELRISRQTFYRHVSPDGSLRLDGRKIIGGNRGIGRASDARPSNKGQP